MTNASIQSLLYVSIWNKNVNGWDCCGIPIQVSLDNAWAHHSLSLEDVAKSINQNGDYNSIDIVLRTLYKGRYGALIERFFGNISAKLKAHLRNAGAIQSSSPSDVRNA